MKILYQCNCKIALRSISPARNEFNFSGSMLFLYYINLPISKLLICSRLWNSNFSRNGRTSAIWNGAKTMILTIRFCSVIKGLGIVFLRILYVVHLMWLTYLVHTDNSPLVSCLGYRNFHLTSATLDMRRWFKDILWNFVSLCLSKRSSSAQFLRHTLQWNTPFAVDARAVKNKESG